MQAIALDIHQEDLVFDFVTKLSKARQIPPGDPAGQLPPLNNKIDEQRWAVAPLYVEPEDVKAVGTH